MSSHVNGFAPKWPFFAVAWVGDVCAVVPDHDVSAFVRALASPQRCSPPAVQDWLRTRFDAASYARRMALLAHK